MSAKKERKLKLKEEADQRAKVYNGMSFEEKLELIRSRRGKSEKESKKILKQIQENKA